MPATPAPLVRALPAVGLVALVPLLVDPGAASSYHAPKWLAVCALVPLGLAAAAWAGRLRWPAWRWWGGWLAASALATFAGVAPRLSVSGSPGRDAGLVALLLGAGAFVVGASLADDADVARLVLRGATLAAGAVGLLAIAERLGLDLPGSSGSTRAGSTWGSATFAGGHLALVLPIAVVLARGADARWRRVAAGCALLAAVGLALTGTRGAWVGAVAAAVVVAPALGAVGRRRIVLVGGLVVALGFGALTLAGPTLERSSGSGRLDLWRTVMPVIADRPVLGSGPDTQRVVLPSGIDERFEQRHGSVELHDRAHDLLLDTLVTTGVVGVAALGGLLLALGLAVHKRLGDQIVARGLAAGLVAYLVHLAFAFGDATLDPIAWLLSGVLVGSLVPRAAAVAAPRVRVVAGAAVAAGLLAVWSGGALFAEHHLRDAVAKDERSDRLGALASLHRARSYAPTLLDLPQVEDRVVQRILDGGSAASPSLDPRTDERQRARLVDRGLSAARAAERFAPDDPDLLLDRAALLTSAGRLPDAVALYRRVLAGPYPESSRAQLGLGTALIGLEDREGAIAAWERAADLAPRDVRALLNLGGLYLSRNRVGLAREAYEEVLRRSPGEPTATRALADLGG